MMPRLLSERLWPDKYGPMPKNFHGMLAAVQPYEDVFGQDKMPNMEGIYTYLLARKAACSASIHAAYALRDGLGRLWGEEVGKLAHRALRDVYHASRSKGGINEKAIQALSLLPERYQDKIRPLLDQNMDTTAPATGRLVWSSDHIANTCVTLKQWIAFCEAEGLPEHPSGRAFIGFAEHLENRDVSPSSIAVYLSRVRSVFEKLLTPGRSYPGAALVQDRWERLADSSPYRCKSANQIIGASAIFQHGLSLISEALDQPLSPIAQAVQIRNGILLAMGTAFPERGRALAALEFGKTVRLERNNTIAVSLPGLVLKRRESRKHLPGRDIEFQNPQLWAAIEHYMAHHRRVIDGSLFLFPDTRRYGFPLAVSGLRMIIRKETLRRFGVAIPIHRLRDNVATEAVEILKAKGAAAPALLNHRDPLTSQKHYDHSTSMDISRAYTVHINTMRGPQTSLDI